MSRTPYAFNLDQYAVLELANDARLRDIQRSGLNKHWGPHLNSFESQFGFRPSNNQLYRFSNAMQNNPNFYHNAGQSNFPRIENPEAAWAEYQQYWNDRGVYGTWQR